MPLIRVPKMFMPAAMSHAKMDRILLARLGIVIPYKCNWSSGPNPKLEAIEYLIPEGAGFGQRDIHQAFSASKLEDGEPDEFEAHRKHAQEYAEEQAEIRAMARERVEAKKVKK